MTTPPGARHQERLTCEAVARSVLGEPLKRQGPELIWRCPNFERHKNSDAHASFKINAQKNVFACFVCGVSGTAWKLAAFLAKADASDKKAVTTWLRERRLLKSKPRADAAKGRGQCVAKYTFGDASGNPLARKLRFEPGAEGRKKDFVWERWENGAWVGGLNDLKLPLYRLREIQNEPLVILTEGEKDADAGARIGLSTTTSGGVGSFREYHAEALRRKAVVVVADSDDAGREHAQKVAGMLQGIAASIKLCEIPHSKDLAEAIDKGFTKALFVALFDDTPEWRRTEGREILDSVMRFIRRFVALSETQARAVALWVAHTHAIDAAECTPYLNVNSAEKESGKTRLLEVCRFLVANPWFTGRVTAAVLVRKIDGEKPTLLLDESDAAFAGEKEYAETLRGILNNGYRRSGKASCCVGQGANIACKDFETFCPKAIAGIGKLSDTVASRSIPICMRREPSGRVEKFRERDAEAEAAPIRARLAAWCKANLESLQGARPPIPESLSDRQADCCESLLTIADLARDEWPEAARHALVELCAEAKAEDQSVGVRLLGDIRDIFEERGIDRISSADLVSALTENESSPWAEWSHGRSLTASRLARLLSRYRITPGTIRVGDATFKGYYRSDFEDSFTRYLPPLSRHPVTGHINAAESDNFQSVTEERCDLTENPRNTNKERASDGVTVSSLPWGGDDGVSPFDAFDQSSGNAALNGNGSTEGACATKATRFDPFEEGSEVLPDGRCKCLACGSVFGSLAGWRAHVLRKRCTSTGAIPVNQGANGDKDPMRFRRQ